MRNEGRRGREVKTQAKPRSPVRANGKLDSCLLLFEPEGRKQTLCRPCVFRHHLQLTYKSNQSTERKSGRVDHQVLKDLFFLPADVCVGRSSSWCTRSCFSSGGRAGRTPRPSGSLVWRRSTWALRSTEPRTASHGLWTAPLGTDREQEMFR